jgi:hypothetical protein
MLVGQGPQALQHALVFALDHLDLRRVHWRTLLGGGASY